MFFLWARGGPVWLEGWKDAAESFNVSPPFHLPADLSPEVLTKGEALA